MNYCFTALKLFVNGTGLPIFFSCKELLETENIVSIFIWHKDMYIKLLLYWNAQNYRRILSVKQKQINDSCVNAGAIIIWSNDTSLCIQMCSRVSTHTPYCCANFMECYMTSLPSLPTLYLV